MTDCSANEDFSPANTMSTSIEQSQSQTLVANMKEDENQQCLNMYNSNDMGEADNGSHLSMNDCSKNDEMECMKEDYGVLRNNNTIEGKNNEENSPNNTEGQMSMGIDPNSSMQNQNHGEFRNSDSPKELVTTHRSPVIASHISLSNVSEVADSPIINNNNDMMEQKQNSLPNQMLSRSNAVDLQDESQDSSVEMKQNDQMESEVEMEGLSRDQLPSDRIILHGGSYLQDNNKQISTLVNAYNLPRSSPSSVTAQVICMGPSSHMNSAYDIPRGQGLPPVSTIIRSTSMARYDRANLHSMSNSHSSILQLPTSTESLHALDISRMNIMADDSLGPSNMSIRNMECFSPPHRSVLVTPTSSHLRSHMMLDQNNSVHHTHSPSPSHCDSSKDDRLDSSLENMHSNNQHIQESKNNSDMMDPEVDHHDLNDYDQSDSIESLRQKYIATSVVSPNPSNSYTEHLKEFASTQFLPMAAIGGLPTNRITPEMAEMLNNMVQKSVASLSRDNNLELGAEMMGDLIQTSIQSAPSSLIISPHQNQQLQRLIINAGTGTSLSSDETSEGSSPLLSVDSDMECKVQDLTRRSMGIDRKHLMVIQQGDNQQTNTCIATHGTPQNLVQSFSRGVITSVMSNNGNILQLCQSNMGEEIETSKSSELVDNGEAEDLSHPSKINCSMSMSENSGVIKNSENDQSSPETSSPLQNVPSSMLPSFLSSLASLSGIPLSLPTSTTVPYTSPTDSSLQASPTGIISSAQPVILSSISNSTSHSNVKQEPGSRLINASCNITSSSGNVYTNLPNLQTMAPYIKQEVPSPSSGSLPPFPVISALKRDAHTSSSMRNSILSSQTTHPIMSVVQTTSGSSLSGFMGSTTHHQLPPYSSMRMSTLPPLSIPGASSSSESPASSPMTGGVPSDASPISLSPGKKNEKLKEMGSISVGATMTMSTAEVVNSLMLQSKEKDQRRWSCPMCRNGSPCGLHPTQMQMATSSLSPGPMPSGDPAKPYQCTVCGKNLASKNVFQLHMRSHSGEKPFRCNLCGHHFSQKTSLTRHMRSHTGERPFPCGVCGKRFADKERIKIHMRTHTGEKPFACEVCAKRFSQKSTVKRHMSVHTGEKPFKCEACGKGFANRGNLNAHAKTHANS